MKTRIVILIVLLVAVLLLIGIALNVKTAGDNARNAVQTNFVIELTGLSQTATARGR